MIVLAEPPSRLAAQLEATYVLVSASHDPDGLGIRRADYYKSLSEFTGELIRVNDEQMFEK